MLAGPLPPSDMEVAFGYRAPLPANASRSDGRRFLPRWVGYAWAFPRPDHISFGIATTQDAFEHQPLDDLLWQFMIGYYQQCEGAKGQVLADETTRLKNTIHKHLRATAERYAARIPGLARRRGTQKSLRRRLGVAWRRRRLCRSGDWRRHLLRVAFRGVVCRSVFACGEPQSYEKSWRADFGAELRRARKCVDAFTATSGARRLPNA
jgi:hypothetical protein